MVRAAQTLNNPQIHTWSDSQSAAEGVRALVKNGDLVFLKASRGTRLELIEP